MEWISVEDELPQRWQKVIAWAANGKNQVKDLMQETLFDGRDFSYGYHSNQMRGVTHWMPMPNPPEDTPND